MRYYILCCLIVFLYSFQIDNTVGGKTESEITKKQYIELIKSDSSMYYNIAKKANQKNKPIEKLIEEEAEVLESEYADIIRIENLIIKNPTWFEEVQNKAKQEKMSIDSAIKREVMRHVLITRK